MPRSTRSIWTKRRSDSPRFWLKDPNNGRVAAGMGFLRMQQNNFGGAVSYLSQAEPNGFKATAVENALATSRFWYVMGEASQAFNENQFDVASQKYREALVMRPRSPEALNGLAGLLTKQQQYTARGRSFTSNWSRCSRIQLDGWRGLFLAYARDNQNQKATAVQARFPAPVKVALAKDPEYLRTLATHLSAENRSADAQRVLAQALALPFPDSGAALQGGHQARICGNPDGGQALRPGLGALHASAHRRRRAILPHGWEW